MRWRRFILSSVFGCPLLVGCAKDPNLLTRDKSGSEVARFQKADVPPPRSSYLDVLPDQPADAVSGEVAARIRATINGYPIFDEEIQAGMYQYEAALRSMPEPDRTKKRRELYKDILDQIIQRELLIQDAQARLKKNGGQIMGKLQDAAEKEFDRRWVKSMKENNRLKTDEDLKELLRSQGLSMDMIKRQWTRQFIATEYMRNRVFATLDKIGHEQIQEYYDTHPEEFKIDDGVEWLDLFVSSSNPRYKTLEDARATANQLTERLRKGEDFKTVAKQFDDGDSSLRDGAGIGKKRGDIRPPDCEEALFDMRPGEVGIIEIGSGFHVFKLVKREFAGQRPCDIEAQKDLRNKLRSLMYEREVTKLVADLKRKAVIEHSRRAP